MSSIYCFAQKESSDKKLLDSLIEADDFLSMLNSLDKPQNYLMLNIGIGNKLFSVNNNSLNAMDQNKKLIFSPSIEYSNKTGLGISVAGFLINNNHTTSFYQYSVTPSYDYVSGKKIEAGISFTKVFLKDKYSSVSSPIQNDLYIYTNFKKTWLIPGIAFGYSTGNYNEINFTDTNVLIQNRPVRLQFTDTVNTNIHAVSISAELAHTFSFNNILSSADAFSFTPQLLLNAGRNKYIVTHRSSSTVYRSNQKTTRTRLRNFAEKSAAPSFSLESLGLNVDINYTIGKVIIRPQVYLDYYLPHSDEKRFTQLFYLNIGYMF